MRKVIIEIAPSESQVVNDAITAVVEAAPLVFAVLFSGDRRRVVEWYAIAIQCGRVVGLASLAPKDEGSNPGAIIIGIWVKSAHRRQGIGTQLVEALTEKSISSYKQTPSAQVITQGGEKLCRKAGISFPQSACPGYSLD